MRISSSSSSSVAWACLLLLATTTTTTHGWVPIQNQVRTRVSPLKDVLGGVSEFEQWFSNLDKATCRTSIQHHAFGSLRGLKCQDDSATDGSVLTVPKDVVLSSSYGDEDWDAQLAQQLWNECRKGRSSEFYGYCSLLARGEPIHSDSVPLSTAPNTLRHWTSDQLDGLALSPRGKKLIALHKAQKKQWKQKYAALINVSTISWEQFEWCMEVVHSRAFRGNYGLSPVRSIVSAAAPLAAAVIGWTYIQGNADISDSVLLGLAAVAASPLLASAVFPDKGEAVLLPLIDSANHLEEADSSIEFNPLGGAFSLSIGSKCLVPEGAETQLYISYGPKSDGELLLNYGFLPGESCEGDDDSQRNQLTKEFIKRTL